MNQAPHRRVAPIATDIRPLTPEAAPAEQGDVPHGTMTVLNADQLRLIAGGETAPKGGWAPTTTTLPAS